MKFRPLRQPQFNRMGSSASSQQSSSTPTAMRSLHSSTTTRQAGASLNQTDNVLNHQISPEPASPPSATEMASRPPLSILPLHTILRSLAVTTISSSSLLLPPSLAIMSLLAHTNSSILNPDHNPLLRSFIKSTFYAQFCAGETAHEVRDTIAKLKGLGFSGVILGYAKEVVLTEAQTKDLARCGLQGEVAEECVRSEVLPWKEGTLETVRLASEGDYVALKFTGAGRQALWTLSQRLPPPTALATAIDEICALAAARGVRLLFDAEQQAVQAGIDDWTLHYMRQYNKNTNPANKAAVIYGTYQAYLKATPRVLAEHLEIAAAEGFALGIKLVRGAYLGSDPRALIWDTKAGTDACYNGIAEALLRRRWMGPLAQVRPVNGDGNAALPVVNMVLASHNAETVRAARAILAEVATDANEEKTEVAFAQLQGMADEVSCEILAANSSSSSSSSSSGQEKTEVGEGMRAYKYLVWGSTGECMKYLLRRAQENKDAVQRTRDGRNAMRAEVWRRWKGVFGLA
ncbi:unnamed protein product [Discula destructiva]